MLGCYALPKEGSESGNGQTPCLKAGWLCGVIQVPELPVESAEARLQLDPQLDLTSFLTLLCFLNNLTFSLRAPP